MATTTIIPLHAGKGRAVAMALGATMDYIKNPDKTDCGQWVTAYECDPLIADQEFSFSKQQYTAVTGRTQGAHDVIGYHLRISFKPGETGAQTANKIGYDLAMKLMHGNHAFVCCTRVDKAHIHSHNVINSTSLDCTKKFRNFKGSSFAIRRIADHLCVENGLSIVANPKPSRGHYGKWQGDTKPLTNRDRLRQMIDAAIQSPKDYDEFIAAMIKAECEVKQGANLAFKIPSGERFLRCKSLGVDYTEAAIRERLAGLRRTIYTPFTVTSKTSFGLLIDIEQKVREGKGPAYEN
ncbi:MAG: relaxase/mobilization nuclease domain-containing protein [Christensenellales bacterium]